MRRSSSSRRGDQAGAGTFSAPAWGRRAVPRGSALAVKRPGAASTTCRARVQTFASDEVTDEVGGDGGEVAFLVFGRRSSIGEASAIPWASAFRTTPPPHGPWREGPTPAARRIRLRVVDDLVEPSPDPSSPASELPGRHHVGQIVGASAISRHRRRRRRHVGQRVFGLVSRSLPGRATSLNDLDIGGTSRSAAFG